MSRTGEADVVRDTQIQRANQAVVAGRKAPGTVNANQEAAGARKTGLRASNGGDAPADGSLQDEQNGNFAEQSRD